MAGNDSLLVIRAERPEPSCEDRASLRAESITVTLSVMADSDTMETRDLLIEELQTRANLVEKRLLDLKMR